MGGIGGSNTRAKLTAHQVWAIKKRYDERLLQGGDTKAAIRRSLARQYGADVRAIEKITQGITWRRPEKGKSWEQWAKEQGLV